MVDAGEVYLYAVSGKQHYTALDWATYGRVSSDNDTAACEEWLWLHGVALGND